VGAVRVALLVRQLTLTVAALVTMATGMAWQAVLVILALLVTSQAGLHSTALLRLVERHPIVALVDVVLVAAAMAALGAGHPVVLSALTSALIIGVLFRWAVVPLLLLLLLLGHVASLRDVEALTLTQVFSTPVVFVSVAAIGVGFRRLMDRTERQERLTREARDAAATAEERLRLARDVHDTVAKSVQGVALLASTLPRWMDRDLDVARTQAGLVAQSAQLAVQEARDLLSGLRSAPEDGDLASWLETRGAAWSRARAGGVRVEVGALPPLAPVVFHEVRRAVQEAMENVDRHAPSADVEVEAAVVGCLVVVVVRDHGPGFCPDGGRRRSGRTATACSGWPSVWLVSADAPSSPPSPAAGRRSASRFPARP
jgi:signal transduction histidine kinase